MTKSTQESFGEQYTAEETHDCRWSTLLQRTGTLCSDSDLVSNAGLPQERSGSYRQAARPSAMAVLLALLRKFLETVT